MKLGTGQIIEIRQSEIGDRQALIRLEGLTAPAAGQYLQAHHPSEHQQAVGITLFPGNLEQQTKDLLLTAPGIPKYWRPGDRLMLRGPLGKGFQMPASVRQLALAAFSPDSEHLLPLAGQALTNNGEVALFTDGPFPNLPARVEINQLANLPDAIAWADLLAVSVALEHFDKARTALAALSPLRCPAQVLMLDQFPCAGIAKCGVCALRDKKRGVLLACEDGPVFNWHQLE